LLWRRRTVSYHAPPPAALFFFLKKRDKISTIPSRERSGNVQTDLTAPPPCIYRTQYDTKSLLGILQQPLVHAHKQINQLQDNESDCSKMGGWILEMKG